MNFSRLFTLLVFYAVTVFISVSHAEHIAHQHDSSEQDCLVCIKDKAKPIIPTVRPIEQQNYSEAIADFSIYNTQISPARSSFLSRAPPALV